MAAFGDKDLEGVIMLLRGNPVSDVGRAELSTPGGCLELGVGSAHPYDIHSWETSIPLLHPPGESLRAQLCVAMAAKMSSGLCLLGRKASGHAAGECGPVLPQLT